MFFFNDTATTEIYTLSLHDALPIYHKFDPIPQEDYYALAGIFRSTETCYGTIRVIQSLHPSPLLEFLPESGLPHSIEPLARSEEHTSELQSRQYLVCRLLLEKKKIQ